MCAAYGKRTKSSWLRPIQNDDELPLRILYPARQSEVEVQAYLWHELCALGYDARCEVRIVTIGGENRRIIGRVDVAIFDPDKKLLFIVETKSGHKPHSKWARSEPKREKKQRALYKRLGVPVHFLHGMNAAQSFMGNLAPFRQATATERQRK